MRTALERLSSRDRQAVEEFHERVKDLLGHELITVKLFGSKARGDDTSESDIDIFITISQRTPHIEDQILDIAFDLGLKYGVYISPRVVSVAVLEDPVWKVTPFLRNVDREGLLL